MLRPGEGIAAAGRMDTPAGFGKALGFALLLFSAAGYNFNFLISLAIFILFLPTSVFCVKLLPFLEDSGKHCCNK